MPPPASPPGQYGAILGSVPAVPAVPAAPILAPGMVAAPPGVAVATALVPVHFVADRESVRVDVRTGTNRQLVIRGSRYGISSRVVERPTFQQLCVAPCTQQFAAGRFQIGVALVDGGATHLIQRAVDAHLPTRVRIHWATAAPSA